MGKKEKGIRSFDDVRRGFYFNIVKIRGRKKKKSRRRAKIYLIIVRRIKKSNGDVDSDEKEVFVWIRGIFVKRNF